MKRARARHNQRGRCFRIAMLCGVLACALVVAALCGKTVALASTEDSLDVAQAGLPEGDSARASLTALPEDAVYVSADGASAALFGSPFSLKEFSRAQVGNNSTRSTTYQGYCYLSSDAPGKVAVVAADDFVVAYVPQSAALESGYDYESPQSIAFLQQLISALDEANAKGGELVAPEAAWYVTSEQVFEREGVRFAFDQELSEGEFYTCVIGVDGSDVTSATNPAHLKLSHANFAALVPAGSVEVTGAVTGLAAWGAFFSSIDYSPLWVTLKTTGVAIIFIFVLGLAAAYFSLRIPSRAQDIADSLFTIPMVLPPTVCGFLLLLAFGKNTGVGQWFIDSGFPLIFSWQATVLAAVVVAFPLMYRSARGAFENLDPNMMDAARTLGWSNARVFFKLMLPLSWSSIAAGTVLSFARALGEFGATLFLAGNYLGITRTIPIAIYFEWMSGNTDVALFWTVVIMIFSFVVILFINLWGRRSTKYRREVKQ